MRRSIIYIILINLFFVSCKNEAKNDSNLEDQNNSNVSKQIKIKGCGFNSLIEIEKNFLPAEDRVIQIIDNIVSYSGLPNNFKVYRADYINNAFATIIENERVIVYDSKLFNDVEWYSDTFWTSVSILAHEIGHHLSGHTEDNLGSVPSKELEADAFSGFVLYKMGATKEQAIKAMSLLGSDHDSETHPSKSKRIKKIEDSWDKSNNQRFNSALPPAPKSTNFDHFYTYTTEMLVDNEIISWDPKWFEHKYFLYGVVTEVDNNCESFNVRIIKTSDEFSNSFRNIDGENWDISIQSPFSNSNTTMCNACASSLKVLLVPGRRIKFSMCVSLPGHGNHLNEMWFLTHLEALPNNYFDKK